MKRTYSIISLLFIIIACSTAQTSVWKISGNGNTLYIGGTIHILRPQDYPLPVEFDSAYAKSEVMVFEADVEELEDPEVAKILLQKAMFKDERTLQSVLSKDVYDRLEEESSKLNIPLTNLNTFKPSLVILTLAVMKMQQLGISAEGVDKHYFSKAKADNKDLLFFETAEEQIDMLVNMGEGNEDEFVSYSLKDFENMEELLSELISTWRDGTAKVMLSDLDEMKQDFPDIYQTLLVDRNNEWIPRIETFLEDETVEYILVGAMHLHGPDGIFKRLMDKGFLIEHLKL